MKKLTIGFMALQFLVGCSSLPSSDQGLDSSKHFVSYHSNKDYGGDGLKIRKPSSASEQKGPWCEDASKTKFVSYGNEKDYYEDEGELYSLCKE